MTEWVPFREPFRLTLTRTIAIAVVAGALAARWAGGFSHWPVLTLLMLWPSLGGHVLDVACLNWLRPRLPEPRWIRAVTRLVVWAVGGILLALALRLTARVVFPDGSLAWLTWGRAALGFVAVELIAHGGLQLRGRPSFYDGRG